MSPERSASSSPRQPLSSAFPGVYHDPLVLGAVAVGLMLGTYALFQIPIDGPLLVVAFSGTGLVYLVDRTGTPSVADQVNHPERIDWAASHRGRLAAETALLLAAGGASVFFLSWSVVGGAAVFGVVAGLHILPQTTGGLNRGGLAKPVVIAGAWAVGGTILPLLEAKSVIGTDAFLFSGYRFLFILPNLLLADWADRVGDAADRDHSWAEQWSGLSVRWVATGLLSAALVGVSLWASAATQPVLVLVDAVGLVLMLGVVWQLDLERPVHAFLADLVVGWPVVTALVAGMIV